MKAIVTGGAGFIGSHLVDRLINEGYDVTVVDSMFSGTMDNLKQHAKNPKLRVCEVDIRESDELNKIFAGHDVVFHLAAQANIRKSVVDHKSDLEHNLVGTMNILDAMIKNNIHDFVFASSSAIYGEATVRPTPEDYSPYQTSLYGASKYACEGFTEAYTEFAPIKFWAFRFANVVGERARRGVIWDFTHKLLANPKELEILGDGKQSKEYFHVQDCVNGIMTGYTKSSAKVNIFNIGLDEQTIVDRVADLVMEEMKLDKAKVKRKYSGGPRGWIGDNPLVVLSIKKLKSLGWKQTVPSEEAIRRTARWTLENVKSIAK
jgi:UDP-glucose 4-epimerase